MNRRGFLIGLGATSIMGTLGGGFYLLREKETTEGSLPSRVQLRQRYLDLVDFCFQEDTRAIKSSLVPIDEFFKAAIQRTPEMVDDLVDIGSASKVTGKSLQDWVTGSRRVEEYIARFLDSYLKVPKGLEAAFEQTSAELQQRWKGHGQKLYASIENDLRGEYPVASFDAVRSAMESQTNSELTVLATSHGLTAAGREVVVGGILSGIAARAIARAVAAIATRTGVSGVSAAAAGTGAMAGPWTAGISIFVGLVAAGLLEYVAGKIQSAYATQQLQQILEEVHRKSKVEVTAAAIEIAEQMKKGRQNGLQSIL